MRPSQGSFPFTDESGTVWLAFTDWGTRDRDHTVLCVHGLTRQGRDFDALGQALAPDFHVCAVDVAGRGRSGWLADKAAYKLETYVRHMDALLAYRGWEAVDWVGTSMGGMIGMALAARPDSPVKRLVLNDVGPLVPKVALERIASYVGEDPRFASLGAVDAYLREVHADFGDLTDAQWSEMTMHSNVRQPDGSYSLHYDPAIGEAFKGPLQDVDLWPLYDRIACPVLVLRGERSDLLTRETAAEMTRRGPRAELVELPGCGHAPALMADEQIAVVRDWLLRGRYPEDDAEEASADNGGR